MCCAWTMTYSDCDSSVCNSDRMTAGFPWLVRSLTTGVTILFGLATGFLEELDPWSSLLARPSSTSDGDSWADSFSGPFSIFFPTLVFAVGIFCSNRTKKQLQGEEDNNEAAPGDLAIEEEGAHKANRCTKGSILQYLSSRPNFQEAISHRLNVPGHCNKGFQIEILQMPRSDCPVDVIDLPPTAVWPICDVITWSFCISVIELSSLIKMWAGRDEQGAIIFLWEVAPLLRLPAGHMHGRSSSNGKQINVPFTWTPIWSKSELCLLFWLWMGLIWLEQSVYMTWCLSGRCLILLFPALLVLWDRCGTAVIKEFTARSVM